MPRAVFLDAVLPYASVNEARNNWRPLLEARLSALVMNGTSSSVVAANISDAATRINDGMWQVRKVSGGGGGGGAIVVVVVVSAAAAAAA